MPLGSRLPTAVLALACLAALPSAAAAAPKTVWLCKPGLERNPCSVSLDTTRFSPGGQSLGTDRVRAARRPAFDCFYVYPTVSDQPTPAATLRVDPEQRSIALYQAARYSRDCRVYAPIYRQLTLRGIGTPGLATAEMVERGYADVRRAWRTYLRAHNRGRGVVLIGHSQGTFVLRRLIREEIDTRPSTRRKLISALLLGGNVTVQAGRDAGGDFRRIGACRSRRQIGCVVAFSTFNGPVPGEARFGRTPESGREILCTNPAALGGGAGPLTPIFPRAPFAPGTIAAGTQLVGVPLPSASTPWLAFPAGYRARCSAADGADVLQIEPLRGAPALRPVPDAAWGLHLVDANVALGNLTDLVRAQAARYLKRRARG